MDPCRSNIGGVLTPVTPAALTPMTKRSQLIPVKTDNHTSQSNLVISAKAHHVSHHKQTYTPFTKCNKFIQIFYGHAKQNQKFKGIHQHTLNVHLDINLNFAKKCTT